MSTPSQPAPLERWTHRVAEVPERGIEVSRIATSQDCAAVAEALDLVACDRLVAAYRLRPIGGGRYRLTGEIEADVVQSCVVSLEPVRSEITASVDEEFWPPELLPQATSGLEGEQEALAALIAEPIVDGRLDVGRLVYEHVATALDPYPRKEGVELPDGHAESHSETARDNPFAVLARLKKEP